MRIIYSECWFVMNHDRLVMVVPKISLAPSSTSEFVNFIVFVGGLGGGGVVIKAFNISHNRLSINIFYEDSYSRSRRGRSNRPGGCRIRLAKMMQLQLIVFFNINFLLFLYYYFHSYTNLHLINPIPCRST